MKQTSELSSTMGLQHQILRNHQSPSQGREFKRRFTKAGTDPFDCVDWEKRDCIIQGKDNKIVFEQLGIEVPVTWSQMATTVVASKYLHGALGTPSRESSIKTLLLRVVNTLSDWGEAGHYFCSPQAKEVFRAELLHALLHQYACFNSPVWFNLGIQQKPQCSACFILSVDDSMESLLELQAIEAKLFKSGSGTGTNLSTVRSSREKLHGGGVASGPLSFMRGYDAWAGSIKSGGKTRRAAKMQILNVEHPDILDFIRCKSVEERKAWALIEAGYDGGFASPGGAYDSVDFQNANLSVRLSDEFMHAVEENKTFFTYKVSNGQPCEELNAREVLKLISDCTHLCGDPGLQFDTTINAWHTCPNSGRINASNPCSEYMHLDNSACNLSSINLLRFLKQGSEFDVQSMLHVVDLLITAQDILIDNSSYPTSKVEQCARDYRQLGLGFANLGAVLMSLGLPYDSDEGREWASLISSLMSAQAYKTSGQIAGTLSPFAGFKDNREPMLNVIGKHSRAMLANEFRYIPKPMVKLANSLWQDAQAIGEKVGFRNSQVTVIAPTGTIAFMMDCDTTGIEPDLALVKYKKLAGGGMLKLVNQSVERGLIALGYSSEQVMAITRYINEQDTIEGSPDIKPEHLSIFDCAFKPLKGTRSIHYTGHLKMMAAVQPFISGAISKTVNLPKEVSPEEIYKVYFEAWKMGLKAVALYRDGSKRTQPMNTDSKSEAAQHPIRRRLPDERKALTHKFSVAGHEGYLTVGMYEDGTPGEIFLVVAKEGSTLSGVMDAFATAISIALQYGVPLVTLIKKFSYMRFEPAGFTQNKEIPTAQSIVDYVFRYLANKFLAPETRLELGIRATQAQSQGGAALGSTKLNGNGHPSGGGQMTSPTLTTFRNTEDAPPCINCGSSLMVRQAGCYYCLNCGSQGGCG